MKSNKNSKYTLTSFHSSPLDIQSTRLSKDRIYPLNFIKPGLHVYIKVVIASFPNCSGIPNYRIRELD